MKQLVGGINARVSGPSGARRGLRQRRLNHGFSVIEMVIVASLALTVGSIVLPHLGQMRENFNIQGDIRVVQTTIQSTRYNAIAQGRQYQIVFQTVPSPQLQVMMDNSPNPQEPPPHAPVWVNRGAPVPLSRSVQLAKGGSLVCDFSGTVTSTGFDVDQGEPYLEMSNSKTGRDYSAFVSVLGRVRIVQNH
ncbi:MAG: hypothetical protein LAO31_04930 [Acidobacteriia bacterium]|nr:hypothetical protein [Terriglobia bacterium]